MAKSAHVLVWDERVGAKPNYALVIRVGLCYMEWEREAMKSLIDMKINFINRIYLKITFYFYIIADLAGWFTLKVKLQRFELHSFILRICPDRQ